MCSSPKAPKATTVVTPPPAAAPQPLAMAEASNGGGTVSQLRIGSKSNMQLRAKADDPRSGLTIPKPGNSRT